MTMTGDYPPRSEFPALVDRLQLYVDAYDSREAAAEIRRLREYAWRQEALQDALAARNEPHVSYAIYANKTISELCNEIERLQAQVSDLMKILYGDK